MNKTNNKVGGGGKSHLVSVAYNKLTVIAAAALIVGGFFAPNMALAAATVTPASGGTSISIDTTSALGGSGVYKSLSGPDIIELVAGDISIGIHTITLPAGWEFEISTINISTFSSDIVFASTAITPSATSFSFEVTGQSTTGGIVGFGVLKVRPTGTVSGTTGNMTYSGAGIVGVDGSMNFGTLSTVAGTVTQLAFTEQPSNTEYGSVIAPSPTVVTRDQFGNNSTNGLIETEMVSMTLSGTGVLTGTTELNIGTGAATHGTATFTDLKASPVETYTLTASSLNLASDVSSTFDITQKLLTATVTVNDKPYDGDNSAVITGVQFNELEVGDDITVLSQGTATFDNINVIEGNNAVSATGVTITGTDALNYNFNDTATGEANITPLEIAITPTVGQSKVYGEADSAFAYTPSPILLGSDEFTSALNRVAGENVATYAYEIGTLSAGDNYALTLVAGTFEITERTLNVTAVGVNKVYDGDTTATVTLSDDRVGGDELTLGYTAIFTDSKNVGVGKPVSVTGISITGGDDASNYILGNTTTATAADITPAQLTVSFTTDANKTYNGNNVAQITGRFIDSGIVGGEDVAVTGGSGSATFVDKHVGTGLTATATGFTLTGVDPGNYEIGTINTTTGNVDPRSITVTAVTDTKTYDGTISSDGTPIVTSTFSPPVALVDTANFIQTFDTKHSRTEKVLTPSGSVDDGNGGNNYTVTIATVSTGEITKKSINVTAQPDTKVYDGTTSSDVAPVVDPLETLDTVATLPTQSYDTEDEGTGKTLTPSVLVINDGNGGANYTIVPVTNTAGVIDAKGLTVTGAISVAKIYNGEINDAEVDFSLHTLDGVIDGEELLVFLNSDVSGVIYSAEFNNKNVATGKQVTVSGLTLVGDGASNYSLTQPVLTDGIITERTLVVTANGTTKVYDSTLDATGIVTLSDDRVSGDVLTFTHTAAFLTKDVANGKDVNVTGIAITGGTDAGNYTLNGITTAVTTANVTPAPLTATITASDKVYDGNNSATITGHTPVVVLGSDVVVLSGGVATFNNFNVIDGNNAVSATGIDITGDDAGNYTYDGTATGEANITPLEITGSFTADNKTYDGNTDADILTQSLTGVLPLDEGNVVLAGGTAEFADPNVNDDIVVTEMVAMELTSSAAGNYTLTSVNTTTANITKAPLSITADDQEREYGDANSTLTATYVGFVGGEDENVLDTSVVLVTDADEISNVDDYVITASGAADNNYEITHNNGTLTVTPAPLTIEPDENQGKIYGEADEEITYEASGFKNGEDKSIFTDALLGREPGENAGDYLITEGTLDVGGNYFVDSFFDVFYTIEQRPLTVTAVTDTKPYDGNATSGVTPTITDGVLQFSDEAVFSQTFDDPNVGARVLTADGIVNDGNGGLNYTYDFSNTAVGEITELEIVITPDAGQSKVFGQLDPTFTYTPVPALIGSDNFTGALDRVGGKDVGTYAYTLGNLSAGGNYSLILETETFEITKAAAVITWGNPADIVYGTALSGTELNATADVDGTFIYTPVSGIVLNAGDEQELSVTFTPIDTANYSVVEQTVVINVNPAPLTVTANGKSKDYGTSDPALTYTHSELVNDDTDAVFSGALTRDSGEDVGEYDINQGTLSVGSNYEITYNAGTLTIEDTVAPTIVSHTPSVNAVNVAVASNISITFSEPVVIGEGDIIIARKAGEEYIALNPATDFTVSGSGTNVITLTPTSAWNNNTIHKVTVTTNVADVNEVNLGLEKEWSFTTATSFSIGLNADEGGWNLISLPVVPTNKNIGAVLSGIESSVAAVWTYDPLNPNAVNGWLVYVPGNPEGTNNLDTMTAGHGYWMSATSNATIGGSGSLLTVGPTTPPSRNLSAGWNLIGYYQIPGEETSQPNAAFASLGGIAGLSGLWGFNNSTGAFTSVTTILPGDAFWVSLPSAKVYTPSNL